MSIPEPIIRFLRLHSINIYMKNNDEEMAIQQFTGFGCCKKDVGIIELATSMGLTKTEFENIKNEIKIYLPPAEFEELEIYFSKIKK